MSDDVPVAVGAVTTLPVDVCARCACILKPGRHFVLRTANDVTTTRCLLCSLRYRPLIKRALLTALVVGSVVTSINQGTIIFRGHFPGELFWKIPLTYCVPIVVSTWGALTNARR